MRWTRELLRRNHEGSQERGAFASANPGGTRRPRPGRSLCGRAGGFAVSTEVGCSYLRISPPQPSMRAYWRLPTGALHLIALEKTRMYRRISGHEAETDRGTQAPYGQFRSESAQRISGLSTRLPAIRVTGPRVRYTRANPWSARRFEPLTPRLFERLPGSGVDVTWVSSMTFRQSLPVLFSTALLLGGHGRPGELQLAADRYAEFLSLFCQERWFEGRIVGCSPPRACVQRPAAPGLGVGDGRKPCLQREPGFRRQWSRIQLSLSRQRSQLPTVPLLRMRALLFVTGKASPRRLEEGLASLLHATELAPEDPALLSDLAALYLLDAQRNRRPLSLVRGLEAALQAIARPDTPPEAFYNCALLLEKLLLTEAAEAAWEQVLRREPQLFWRKAARVRLAVLRRTEERSPQDAKKLLELRDRAWRELLPALESQDLEEARAALETLRAIADTITERSGDPLLREAVSRLLDAFQSKNQAGWRDLVRGHALFESGYQAYQRGELSRASEDLATAARLLKRRGSPFYFWPRFYIACALQQEERYKASLEAVRHLRQSVGDHPYWSLLGYIAWMEGHNRVLLGRPLEALDYFRDSLTIFVRNGEQDNQAAVHALLADSLLELGRQEDAWQELYQGLRLGQRLVQPRRAVVLFTIAADANLQYRRPRVAKLFQDRAFAASAAIGNPKISYLSLLSRGLAAAAGADLKTARGDLHAARTLIASISDNSSRRRARADLAILEAAVDSELGRVSKIRKLTEALALYRELRYQTAITIAAYEERSRLLAAEGDFESSAADLQAALQLYEQRLLDRSNDQIRWSLHTGAQRSYERLIALRLEMGDPRGAFRTAERSRQFSLYSMDFRSLLQGTAGLDLTIEEVQRRLVHREVLVFYKLMESELLIWIIRQDRAHLLRRPCDAGNLRRAINDFARQLRSGSREAEVGARSRVLFDALFADVLREAEPEDLLVLVPDRELSNLPAAAVFTPEGEPLGKMRALIIAPSVEVYLGIGQRSPARTARPTGTRRALILSNPTYDSRVWSGLAPLAWAEAEGAAVSRLYSERLHLVGAAATRSLLVREATRADVIHFAGHAILNPHRPDLSVLLLAGEPSQQQDGAVYQHEIYHLDLRRSPVVILGACDSASLSGNPGEGLSSLAHAFLSAGASAVVGTLWPVEDETAARFMLHLHDGLQNGLSPERALQQAQTRYLENERLRQRDPWGWAAFQVLGASHSPKEAPDA